MVKPTLTTKETKLLDYIRDLGFGRITIEIRDGQPVRIEAVLQSILL
jgi:hypothetical protein